MHTHVHTHIMHMSSLHMPTQVNLCHTCTYIQNTCFQKHVHLHHACKRTCMCAIHVHSACIHMPTYICITHNSLCTSHQMQHVHACIQCTCVYLCHMCEHISIYMYNYITLTHMYHHTTHVYLYHMCTHLHLHHECTHGLTCTPSSQCIYIFSIHVHTLLYLYILYLYINILYLVYCAQFTHTYVTSHATGVDLHSTHTCIPLSYT